MPEHRSHSQLTLYLRCGLAYQKRYIDKEPQTPSTWLPAGSAAHRANEQWELTGRREDPGRLYDIFLPEEIETCKIVEPDVEKWTRTPRTKSGADDLERRNERIREGFLGYIRDAQASDWLPLNLSGRGPAVEVEFDVTLGGVRIVGSVDLVLRWPDGRITVRDLKTGNRINNSWQLGLYKVALAEQFGLTCWGGEFCYLKDGASKWVPPAEWARYTPEYFGNLYSRLDRGIKNEVFLPNPDNCFLCEFRRDCKERN